MTLPDNTNEIIAEFCGWRYWHDDSSLGNHWTAPDDYGKGPGRSFNSLPSYTTSLDACAEFEARLKLEQCDAYGRVLWSLVSGKPEGVFPRFWSDLTLVASATAAQRCLALLWVIKAGGAGMKPRWLQLSENRRFTVMWHFRYAMSREMFAPFIHKLRNVRRLWRWAKHQP